MAQVIPSQQAIPDVSNESVSPAIGRIRAAQALLKQDRARGWNELNDIFRSGQPSAPDGRCDGELIAVNIAPGVTQVIEGLLRLWLPWQGKAFDPKLARGANIFSRSAYLPSHILFPFYRGYTDDGAHTFRAFAFRTYVAPGKEDPGRQVVKIDYDSPDNPRLSVRRVLDELVDVGEGNYLGKAHLHWLWGSWQMVAFFLLRSVH